jgi:hypothetical protein
MPILVYLVVWTTVESGMLVTRVIWVLERVLRIASDTDRV